jgi:hypothetical protein
MMRLLDRRASLALVPLAFLIYCVEQGIFIASTLALVREGFPKWFRLLVPPLPAEQQIAASLLLLLLATAALFKGGAEKNRSWGMRVLLWMLAMMVVNLGALLVAAAMRGGYVAGLGTAVAIHLPLAILLGTRAWRERWLGRSELLLLAPAGLVARGPIFFGFLFIAGYLLGLVKGI